MEEPTAKSSVAQALDVQRGSMPGAPKAVSLLFGFMVGFP
jgi:hypothetical protein